MKLCFSLLSLHPPSSCRADILRQYARHLGDAQLLAIAAATPGMAGRDLRDVCEQAERRWASKVRLGEAVESALAVALASVVWVV